jgi:hypothetical protein
MPVDQFALLSEVPLTGVTVSPPPMGEATLTVIVFGLTMAVPALTVTVADVLGPVVTLQATAPAVTVATSELLALRAPAPAVRVSSATSALAPRIFDTDKSMEDLPSFFVRFFSTTREEATRIESLRHISVMHKAGFG